MFNKKIENYRIDKNIEYQNLESKILNLETALTLNIYSSEERKRLKKTLFELKKQIRVLKCEHRKKKIFQK